MWTKSSQRRRAPHYPRYLSRFLQAYLDECRAITDAMQPELWQEIETSIAATLAAPEGKLPDPKVALTQRQQFFQRLRLDFDELHTCFETLSDFPALSRMPWPQDSALTASKVILFWREAHFNECYIYHLRFLAFLKHLVRAYRKDPRQGNFVAALDVQTRVLEGDFEWLKNVRSQHVHEFRHRQVDPEMDRLTLLELLAREGKQPFRTLYQRAVRIAKANNVRRFKAFGLRMRRELEGIFRIICSFLVSREGRLIYPSQLKA